MRLATRTEFTLRQLTGESIVDPAPESCETCDGTGLEIVGEIPRSWSSPAELLTEICRSCGGKGER